MYILKNALVNIFRNKGRNILIGLIIIVISASCAITLSIRNSALKIVDAYNKKYEVTASIGMNRENLIGSFKKDENSQEEMIEKFNEIENVTIDEIKKYGDSDYVSSYYYVYNLRMDAKNIEEATDSLVKEETTTTTKTEEFGGMGPGGFRGNKETTTTTKREEIFNQKAMNGAFTIMGYSSYEGMKGFIDGSYTITDGEVSSDFTSNSCVISEELATLNELKVNDKIVIVNPNNEDLEYELIITGIYTEQTDDASDMTNMFTKSANMIITNIKMTEKMIEDDKELNATLTPTFVLKNADVLDSFKKEVEDKGLSEYYTVTDNLETVEAATKSITNVKTFATIFLIITLIIGSVVLLVINMINIRERKYEIGVLRTIGMKRISVIFQFMTELLIVCILALSIGAGLGAASSVSVANVLLENEINNAEEEYQNINNNFGGGMDRPNNRPDNMKDNKINGLLNIEQVDTINAVVDTEVLAQLFLIGIVLTIISSISSCVMIARFSPLTILKERT